VSIPLLDAIYEDHVIPWSNFFAADGKRVRPPLMDERKFKSLITPFSGYISVGAWRLFFNRFGIAVAATFFDTLMSPNRLYGQSADQCHFDLVEGALHEATERADKRGSCRRRRDRRLRKPRSVWRYGLRNSERVMEDEESLANV
jgi:hypothetical protein